VKSEETKIARQLVGRSIEKTCCWKEKGKKNSMKDKNSSLSPSPLPLILS